MKHLLLGLVSITTAAVVATPLPLWRWFLVVILLRWGFEYTDLSPAPFPNLLADLLRLLMRRRTKPS